MLPFIHPGTRLLIVKDFRTIGSPGALAAFLQVLMIDVVLAGDNAIVVGMAVAGLPSAQKGRAILVGIGVATLLRIGFAFVTPAVQARPVTGAACAAGASSTADAARQAPVATARQAMANERGAAGTTSNRSTTHSH